jgi:hypothetical protein
VAELILVFIGLSWLLVTLIIWWFKHNIYIKKCNDDIDMKNKEEELYSRLKKKLE